MTEFTPIMSLGGGFLIGLAAVALMFFWGRIAGMTAITGGILPPYDRDWAWKVTFLAGAIAAPVFIQAAGYRVEYTLPVSTTALVIGGVITGIGVTFGSGCTSGHGICGIARFSKRSIVATATFLTFGIITVYFIRHVLGVSI